MTRKRSVLITDDDDLRRSVLARTFEVVGWDVQTATWHNDLPLKRSEAAVVHIPADATPSLIVARLEGVPVVAVVHGTDPPKSSDTRRAEPIVYLKGPVPPSLLIRAVEKLIVRTGGR